MSMKPTDHTNFQQRARVDRRQRQPGPGHIVFRPNLGSVHKTGGQGHKFSASQVISSHLARRQKVCLEWSDVWGQGCQCDSGGICHDVTKTRMDLEQFSAPSPLIVCASCSGETSCPVFRRDNHQMTCLPSNYQR